MPYQHETNLQTSSVTEYECRSMEWEEGEVYEYKITIEALKEFDMKFNKYKEGMNWELFLNSPFGALGTYIKETNPEWSLSECLKSAIYKGMVYTMVIHDGEKIVNSFLIRFWFHMYSYLFDPR